MDIFDRHTDDKVPVFFPVRRLPQAEYVDALGHVWIVGDICRAKIDGKARWPIAEVVGFEQAGNETLLLVRWREQTYAIGTGEDEVRPL